MTDIYINSNRFLKYIDSCNYYDVDVDNILFKKSDNKYIVRYNDVNKMMIVPLQLKINNLYNEINTFENDNRVMLICNDDTEFFRKYIEIQDKIIKLIGIDNHIYFLKADDNDELFIITDVHENTSFVLEDNYRYGHYKGVKVLHSVINVLKHHQFNTDINTNNHINKHKVKYIITVCMPKLL